MKKSSKRFSGLRAVGVGSSAGGQESSNLDLGDLLKEGRLSAGLTQAEVAAQLGLRSAQSVSDWERGRVASAPVQSLKKLVKIYGLDESLVFEALFRAEMKVLEDKLRTEFYGARRKAD